MGILAQLSWLHIVFSLWQRMTQPPPGAGGPQSGWRGRGKRQRVGKRNLLSPAQSRYSVSLVVAFIFALCLDVEGLGEELENMAAACIPLPAGVFPHL